MTYINRLIRRTGIRSRFWDRNPGPEPGPRPGNFFPGNGHAWARNSIPISGPIRGLQVGAFVAGLPLPSEILRASGRRQASAVSQGIHKRERATTSVTSAKTTQGVRNMDVDEKLAPSAAKA